MKVAVAMSGGTTPVINASLFGVQSALESTGHYDSLYFLPHGGYGDPNLPPCKVPSVSVLDSIGFRETPGSSFTGTGRGDWKNMHEVVQSLGEHKFDAFINIGGNGTLQNSLSLTQELEARNIAICNIPKTVDNDLGDLERQLMHVTPGYVSSLEYLCRVLKSIEIESVGSHSHDRAIVLQTFGRNTGFLSTGSSVLMNKSIEPLLTVIPEGGAGLGQIMSAAESIIQRHDRAIIVIAEGHQLDGLETLEHSDQSGQKMHGTGMTTPAQFLANSLTSEGIRARVCIPTVLQRVGLDNQNKIDRELAERVGDYSVRELLQGNSSFLVGINPELEANRISFDQAGSMSRGLSPTDVEGPFEPSQAFVNYVLKLKDKFDVLDRDTESIRFE